MFTVGAEFKFAHSDYKGKVLYGPVSASGTGKPSYLVEWQEGLHLGGSSLVWEEDMSPLPKFKVGQKVSVTYAGDHLTVKAGPFPQSGEVFWVVEDGDKDHLVAYEMDMVPVVE